MKRILCFALCLTLVFLLLACQKKSIQELTLDDQIKQAYLSKTNKNISLGELSVRYIYHFDDAYAVFVDCSLWSAPAMLTDVQVGDYLFSFSNTQEMLIYKNDACYSLTQAYEQKLLTNEQWKLLHDTWKEQNPHLYADVFDNDDLFAMMDEAEKLLQSGKYTIENPSSYVQYFL